MRNAAGNPRGTATFAHVPLGAGGYVTGLSMSSNGATKVCRCDVHGAYVRGTSDTIWRCLWLSTSIPSGLIHGDHQWDGNFTDRLGCAEVVVAPSDPTFILATYDGYLLKSTDTGATFVNTGAPRKILYSNNPASRVWGRSIAIHPTDTTKILYGTQGQDVYYSINSGTAFTALGLAVDGGGFTNPNEPGGNGKCPHLVAVNPAATTWVYWRQGVGGFSSATVNGVYAALPAGGPTSITFLKYDSFGTLWVVEYGVVNNLWKLAAGVWTHFTNTVNNQFVAVAVDPGNANHLVAIDGLGKILKSADGGTTWPYFWNNDLTQHDQQMRVNSIKWLDVGPSQQWEPVTGWIEFDPVVANKLWCATGVGIYSCDVPATTANQFKWFEDSLGIEELVSHDVIVPPGGKPIIACHDQGMFRIESLTRFTNPQKAPVKAGDTFAAGLLRPGMIQPTTGLDYAADNPLWIACLNHGGFYSLPITNPHNGFSTDGGVTWSMWPTVPLHKPYTAGGGSIAVGNAGNVIILWNANGMPTYTKDSGSTWADLPLPGIPADGVENGFEWQGAAYFLNKRMICYDKTGGAFYLFNYGPPTATSLLGVWKSTTRGDSWTQVYSGAPVTNYVYNVHLRAVPGQAGHLFMCSGVNFTDTMVRSTNGGVSWTACTGITAVTDVAFGKAATGKSYPSIYFWGAVSGAFGLYRSDDNLATTVLLAAHPGNWLDYPMAIAGDPDVYGRVYMCFSGSGAMVGYYDFGLKLAA